MKNRFVNFRRGFEKQNRFFNFKIKSVNPYDENKKSRFL